MGVETQTLWLLLKGILLRTRCYPQTGLKVQADFTSPAVKSLSDLELSCKRLIQEVELDPHLDQRMKRKIQANYAITIDVGMHWNLALWIRELNEDHFWSFNGIGLRKCEPQPKLFVWLVEGVFWNSDIHLPFS